MSQTSRRPSQGHFLKILCQIVTQTLPMSQTGIGKVEFSPTVADRYQTKMKKILIWKPTEGKDQALVRAIPFSGEYPDPRFDDKL